MQMIPLFKDKLMLDYDINEAKLIYDKFLEKPNGTANELSKILGHGNKETHNCLGCNFYNIFISIRNLTLVYDIKHQYYNRRYFLYNYYQWSNLVIEHLKYIAKTMKENEIDSALLNTDKYDELVIVNKIANFFKHPKAFIFTHHLIYLFDYERSILTDDYTVIDFNYILRYFTGNKKVKYNSNDFFNEFANKKIAIVFPPISVVTSGICKAFEKIIKSIKENNEQIEFLKKHSNI